jgi:polyribonucleotide nucleotidyltransferase
MKRDGGGSDNSILNGRIIDRSIRPLFPAGFKNEVQLIVTVLSNDKESDVIIPAFLAASAAISISDIPFNAPVSIIRMSHLDGKLVSFPSLTDLAKSELDLLICHDPKGVNMIEAEGNIINNELMLSAMKEAMDLGQNINTQLAEFAKKYGKKKIEFVPQLPSTELMTELDTLLATEISKFMSEGQDGAHIAGEEVIKTKAKEEFAEKMKSGVVSESTLMEAVDLVVQKHFRQAALDGHRYDKRGFDQVRPLNIEAGYLPCTHGSALFERGLTQALTVTTLGPISEQQYLQDSFGETSKRYIHYYSGAPFSTGQTGRLGRPGRREVGHGALAEKALVPVIPSIDEFPYTIILTSEVLSQNGSSSMASTCGSTMSLMDAGVPIKDKVAGISVGMISDDSDKYILLTDIAGIEDHWGDMDFKITGTRTGITAIQLDIKRSGLSYQMIVDTFVASTTARMTILDKMDSVLATHRPQLSKFAPKIKMINLPEDKIGEVIGSGGKTIKGLMEKYGVSIDIDDEGRASISAIDQAKIDDCVYEIESMIKDVVIGEVYDGVVTRVEAYGAFVEFLPGREALLHVSELSGGFISDPNSIIKVGDALKVTIAGYNDNHQIKLSAPEFKQAHPGNPDAMPQRNERPPFDRDRAQGGFRNFASRGPQRPRR